MTPTKKQLLKIAYQRVLAVTLMDLKAPLKWADEYVSESIIGFGTAADEKVFSKKDYRKIVINNRKQAKGLALKCELKTKYNPKFTGENTACSFDEFIVTVGKGSRRVVMPVSVGLVFEFYENKWKLIGLYASKIDTDTSSEDTFHLREAEKKMQELQLEVAARTEELSRKNNELKIEAALERVRAIAMSMNKAADMLLICKAISEQLKILGVKEIRNVQTAIFYESKGTYMNYEYYAKHNKTFITGVEYKKHKIQLAFAQKMMKGPSEEFVEQMKGKKLQDWYAYQKTTNQFADKYLVKAHSLNYYWFSLGPVALGISTYYPLRKEETDLFKRFLKVFELAYRRYLDIEKATAQAKEAQIEAALERVRAKSMAMQQPNELREVAELLRKEMGALGIEALETSSIYLVHPSITECWYAIKDVRQKNAKLLSDYMEIQLSETWVGREMQKFYKGRQKQASIVMKGNHRKEWINYCASKSSGLKNYYGKEIPERTYHVLKFAGGYMGAVSPGELSSENWDVLGRATTVFALAYTRFKDLQESANRAREAEIELALERVRAKSMAMHKSDELKEVIKVVLEQLVHLNIKAEHAGFYIDYKAHDDMHIWLADPNIDPFYAVLPYFDSPTWKSFLDAKTTGKSFYTDLLDYKAKNKFYKSLFNIFNVPEEAQQFYLKCKGLAVSTVLLENVGLYIENFSAIPYTEEENKILMRFAKVFEQSYTRFLDLQKAESQAREAQIQLALERVRGRTMAMQNSNELSATVQVMFEECRKLQPTATDSLSRGFITTIHQNKKMFDLWITEIDGTKIDTQFKISFDEPTTGMHIHKAWKQKKPYFINDLQGPVLDQWLDYLESTGFKIAPGIRGTRRVNTFIFYSNGFIGITSSVPLEEENIQILQRFAKVFDQTYTRFLDLQKAEAAAKEAIKQAALDRIRADIASMRTIEDLNRITPLIWNELTILGVPFIRCGVFIMDEEVEQIHTFLSTPDGKSIAAFHLSFTESENIINIVSHWQNKKVYSNHWDEKDFDELADSLVKQTALTDKAGYLQSIPATGIHLNFLPFLQGMLYVGNELPLMPDDIHLLQAVADAFSTAYARYEDFNKLEMAKQVVEKTLNELKSTQQQLIQSEKMASLGELTAGIAHEIQNPLNFVNNFSELNNELLQELGPLDKLGVTADQQDILKDLQSNSEKINHHGQRAASIVKGMLQHSRSSSATKEPTDINALCDEYLRLAYHGLRAKDKSFNAEFKTEFDETLPKVNIVPQDMGRVILNLINNAFYACTERSRSAAKKSEIFNLESYEQYTPLVTVTTKNLGNKIEINISDNGTGIPNDIKEKIFQPFFTTKPTGQGTGLGLSLAYDIVTKLHGGKLTVESEQGSGTTFIISIPS
jgi:signal transduction histidine kinase